MDRTFGVSTMSLYSPSVSWCAVMWDPWPVMCGFFTGFFFRQSFVFASHRDDSSRMRAEGTKKRMIESMSLTISGFRVLVFVVFSEAIACKWAKNPDHPGVLIQ